MDKPVVTTIEIGDWCAMFLGDKLIYWNDWSLTAVLDELETQGLFTHNRVHLTGEEQKQYIGWQVNPPDLPEIMEARALKIYLEGTDY